MVTHEFSSTTRLRRAYFVIAIGAGVSVAVASGHALYVAPPPSEWLVLAALTLLTGSFTIKITRLAIRISVSDAFVFAAVLLYGADAGTAIVAIDSIVASILMRREYRSVLRSLYNVAVASLSLWTAATLFYWLVGSSRLPHDADLTTLLGPLFVLAAVYFLMNSWLIAIVLGFEQGGGLWALWREHFPWFSLNYFGGVSAAALLVSYTRTVDIGAVSIILPLLVISYLTYRTALDRLQDAQRHVDQLNQLYISTIETLAMAVDAKDQITHGHIRRVQVYAVELAKRLGVTDEPQLKAIEAAALLHDMGKLAIPEHILNKPGKLTPAEFEKMKRHADIGADLLSSVPFPYPVVPIVRHHHEHWDGTGYPSGISGTDIPIGARILSVVDCFDALTSDRPYRPKLTPQDAFEVLRARRGTMYDPLAVDHFLAAYPVIAPAAELAGTNARSFSIGDFRADRLALSQIRANASETAILAKCVHEIDTTPRIRGAIEIASHALRQLTPATTYAYFRYDTTADTLVCDAASNDAQQLLHGLTIQLGERVTGWSAANRKVSANSDAILDLAQLANSFTPPLRSVMAVPLVDGDHLIGVLSGYSHIEDGFTPSHIYAAEHIAAHLGKKLVTGVHSGQIVPFGRPGTHRTI